MMKITCGGLELTVPDYLNQMDTYPDDPPDSVSYGMQTDKVANFMLIYPIFPDNAMPFHAPQIIIDSIHRSLGDNQGLIHVEAGQTASGKRYVCSVVKSGKKPSGVQYILVLQIEYPDRVLNIQSYYDEIGITGMRDSIIYEQAIREGKVSDTFEGWFVDPYDPSYTKGLRMNLSERVEYDKMFPDHPLSVLRSFLEEEIRNN